MPAEIQEVLELMGSPESAATPPGFAPFSLDQHSPELRGGLVQGLLKPPGGNTHPSRIDSLQVRQGALLASWVLCFGEIA